MRACVEQYAASNVTHSIMQFMNTVKMSNLRYGILGKLGVIKIVMMIGRKPTVSNDCPN